MGLRQDIVDETVEYFVNRGELSPSNGNIRFISNQIGESFVEDGLMTMNQWEQISQDRTLKLVKTGLRKIKPQSVQRRKQFEEREMHEGVALQTHLKPAPRRINKY